jgi:hypothetical protein
MKRALLAIAVLLGLTASFACADYVILITNLGEKNVVAPGPGPGPGPRPMPPPMPMGPGPGPEDKPAGAGAILVTCIVEVDSGKKELFPKLDVDRFDAGQATLTMHHRWGKAYLGSWKLFEAAAAKDLEIAAALRVEGEYKGLRTVSRRYAVELEKIAGNNPDPQKVLELARWCLEHGRIKEFGEAMDKLNKPEEQKMEPVAIYRDLKAKFLEALPEPVTDKLGNLVKNLEKHEGVSNFFAVYAPPASVLAPAELKARVQRYEDHFKAFYYWFALQEIKQPLPKQKLIIVLQPDDDKHSFHTMEKTLKPVPRVADGFFAKGENATVLSTTPLDTTYDLVLKKSTPLWDKRFDRSLILVGRTEAAGIPLGASPIQALNARGYTLMLKALEYDSEIASASHSIARQLVYATGMLPRNVNAPEWVQFGMASFFETPPGAPWRSYTAISHLYWPAYRKLQEGKDEVHLEAKPLETMRRVVTDSYFREDTSTDSAEVRGAKQLRARATAWSLTFFLMNRKLAGLQRFNKELSRLPRDLALDGEVVWGCFERAFNKDKLEKMATEWDEYMQHLGNTFESYDLYKTTEALKEKVKNIGAKK